MNVAIIGASNQREKYGNKAVRSYIAQGHTVYPINPKEETIEGLRAYAALADVPAPLDRILLYVPPAVGVQVIEQAAAAQSAAEVWVNPGADSEELFARAAELGVPTVFACAILDIGESPARY